jgi:Uma2 family endonuclease
LHGIAQKVVAILLENLGYFTGTEVDLHIDPRWRPRPDILASTQKLERPYPTHPEHLFVVEILSSDDRWGEVHEKCESYERITKIRPVYILNAERRKGWEWNIVLQNTERITALALPHGDSLPLNAIWERVEQQI